MILFTHTGSLKARTYEDYFRYKFSYFSYSMDYSVANKLLLKFIAQDVELFTTKEILEEFSEVLIRDFKYSLDESKEFMRVILGFVSIVNPVQKFDVVKNDPEDNAVLECAIASYSKYIITYDNHLLELKDFRSVKIITPEKMFGLLNGLSEA